MKKGIFGLIGLAVGASAGALAVNHLLKKDIEEKKQKVNKFKSYYNVLNQWLILKETGKSVEQYFIDNHYKTAAIYGMGEMGKRLYEELKDSDALEIKYALDANASCVNSDLTVKTLDDVLEPVDVVIVTATFAFDEIQKQLQELMDSDIISLDTVLFEI